jgi:hypothetical protein
VPWCPPSEILLLETGYTCGLGGGRRSLAPAMTEWARGCRHSPSSWWRLRANWRTIAWGKSTAGSW